jgi:hypothetical protein
MGHYSIDTWNSFQKSEIWHFCFLLTGMKKHTTEFEGKEALTMLFALRRSKNLPLPMTVMSFVVCEWNTDCIERAFAVAQELNVFTLNYNMRWFLTEEIGLSYERHLERFFGLKSSGAWRGWISNHADTDYSKATHALEHIVRSSRFQLKPPFAVTTPKNLRRNGFKRYFTEYSEVFGNETCFMPFY